MMAKVNGYLYIGADPRAHWRGIDPCLQVDAFDLQKRHEMVYFPISPFYGPPAHVDGTV
jgi:hypothetical protein